MVLAAGVVSFGERRTPNATVVFNLPEKLRLFFILVCCLQSWILLNMLSSFAGPLHT